jgi:hypothetical protein
LATSAAFIQSWLPTVPPAPKTTLVGSAFTASITSLSDLNGELSLTMTAPKSAPTAASQRTSFSP